MMTSMNQKKFNKKRRSVLNMITHPKFRRRVDIHLRSSQDRVRGQYLYEIDIDQQSHHVLCSTQPNNVCNYYVA